MMLKIKQHINYYLNESKWHFLIRFSIVFIFLYAIFSFFIAVAMPGGIIENEFLFKHCNVIQLYTDFIIHSVIKTLDFFEIPAWRNGNINIKTSYGGVNIIYACLAIGINCVWLAYVIAIKNKLSKKLLWISIGTCSLFILNITRISLILYVQKISATQLELINMDHHTLFDIACYLVLILLGWIYYKSSFVK